MRISTNEFLLGSLPDMLAQESNVNQLNRQIAAGQTMLDASSDPVGAGQSMETADTIGQLTYDAGNAQAATTQLQTAVGTLQQVSTVLDQLLQTATQAANATAGSPDRQSLIGVAQQLMQQLEQLANTQGADGGYIFAGSSTDRQPFQVQPSGQVVFAGDAGSNTVQVSPSLAVPATISGQNIFMNIAAGTGGVGVMADPANTGGAYALAQSVTSISQIAAERVAGTQFAVSFSAAAGGGLTYTVTSGSGSPGSAGFTATSGVVASGAYAQGAAVDFGGIDLQINGTPAAGDSFSVNPGASLDIFQIGQDLISALQSPQPGQPGGADTQQQIENVLAELGAAQTSVLTAQGALGSRLTELQAVIGQDSALGTNAQAQLSNLQSANLPQVIANYSESLTALQAAQLAFGKIQGLTLFSVIHG